MPENRVATKTASYFDPIRPWRGSIDDVIPFHEDRLIVKRLPWPFVESGVIESPDLVKARAEGDQYGEVVRIGKGQKTFAFRCKECRAVTYRGYAVRERAMHDYLQIPSPPECIRCGQTMKYTGAYGFTGYSVEPGQRVIYQRWPSNEFTVDGETYTALYEEQSILAIVD